MQTHYTCSFMRVCFLVGISILATSHAFSQYCTPTYTGDCSFHQIASFSLSNVSQSTGCATTYTDYTASQQIEMSEDCSYSFGVTGGQTATFLAIYADLNADNDFADTDEMLFLSPNASVDHFGNISLPVTASEGLTRLRVMVSDANNFSSDGCGTYADGETEDYSLNIQPKLLADAGTDFQACTGSGFMDALDPTTQNPGAVGTWSVIDGSGNFDNVNDPKTGVSNIGAGVNRFEWFVVVHDCASRDTVEVIGGSSTTWNGLGNDSDWSNGSNWSNGVPGTCSRAIIPAGSGSINIQNAASVAVLDLDSGSTLNVMSTGALTLYDEINIDGTLFNNGLIQWNTTGAFNLGNTGHYIHRPTNPENAISSSIFSDGNEQFMPSSTVTINRWHDAEVGLFSLLTSDLGTLNITTNGNSAIRDNNGPKLWYQENTLQSRISQDLNITNAHVVLASSPEVETGGISGLIQLTVDGDINLLDQDAHLLGMVHLFSAPNSASSADVQIQANAINITGGKFYVTRNNHASVPMNGTLNLVAINGMTVNNGFLYGASSNSGIKGGSTISVAGDLNLIGSGEFIGVSNTEVNLNMTGQSIVLNNNSTFFGSRTSTHPQANTVILSNYDLTINGGTFYGGFANQGPITLNLNSLVVQNPSTPSHFTGAYNTQGVPGMASINISTNNLTINDQNGRFTLSGAKHTGAASININGDFNMLRGLCYFRRESGTATVFASGNYMQTSGEIRWYEPFNFQSNNNDVIQMTVGGHYMQTGGIFQTDKEANNVGQTRILDVKGNMSFTGGFFRPFADSSFSLKLTGINKQILTFHSAINMENMEVDNSAGVQIDSSSVRVDDGLNLVDGQIIINNSDLRIATNGLSIPGGPGTNRMFVTENSGKLYLGANADGTLDFPLGENTGTVEYAPARITLSSGTYDANSEVGMGMFNSQHPMDGSDSNYLDRYWSVDFESISGFTADFIGDFAAADVKGDPAKVLQAQLDGSLPWIRGAAVNTTTNQVDFSGISDDADFTGVSDASPSVTIEGPAFRCSADSGVVLTANVIGDGPFTFQWTQGATLDDSTIQSPTATPDNGTTYSVTVTDANGFSATSADFSMDVAGSPAPPITDTTATRCLNAPPTPLTATGDNVTWYDVPGQPALAQAPSPSTADTGVSIFFTRDSSGGCFSRYLEVQVTVREFENGFFSYPKSRYCAGESNPVPDSIATLGGSFGADAGVSINSANGEIDLANSSNGIFEIYYLTPGECGDSTVQNIEIQPGADGRFEYPNLICENSGSVSAQVFQNANAGTFSSNTLTISDTTTGEIDLNAASSGFHTVYNALPAQNGCAASIDSFELEITPQPTPPTDTGDLVYCLDETATALNANGTDLQWYSSPQDANPSNMAPTPSTNNTGSFSFFVTQTVNGCESKFDTIKVDVYAPDNASFAYAASQYCASAQDPLPNIQGQAGGFFTASGSMVVDSASGKIDVSATPLGTYTVTYNTQGFCPNTQDRVVEIISGPSAEFTYKTTICLYGDPDTAQLVGNAQAGTFSSSTIGFTNIQIGALDLSSASGGTHRVYNDIPAQNGCLAVRDSFDVNIVAGPAAPQAQNFYQYCQNEQAQQLSAQGTVLEWFTQATGGQASSLAPTPNTSTAGTFSFWVAENDGTCAGIRTQIDVNVVPGDDASFDYTASAFCQGGTDPTPVINVTQGGAFSATNNLQINPNTGTIDLSASAAGSYDITYETFGACPDSQTIQLDIDLFTDGSFFYPGTHCVSDFGTNPIPFINSGPNSGNFSSSAGLIFTNNGTGEIDLENSSPGLYSVLHNIAPNGSCPGNNFSSSIRINPPTEVTINDATIDCGDNLILQSSVNQGNGTYFWEHNGANTPNISVNPTNTTSYIVQYDAGNGCFDIDTAVVTVIAPDVQFADLGEACEGWSAFVLEGGTPLGGTYSGPGVSNNIFYPNQTGTGTFTITYNYDDNGCMGSASTQIVVDACLGLDEYDQAKMKLYPNPNAGNFEVNLPSKMDGSYEILDIRGRLIQQHTFKSKTSLIVKQADLPSGVYHFRLLSDNYAETIKLTIQH